MEIPQSYIIEKLNTFSTKIRQTPKYINGGCPICHEGKSWGAKARLYYYLEDDFLYCFNCGKSWNPYWWVKELTGMSYKEIQNDILDSGYDGGSFVQIFTKDEKEWILPEIPGECVNLKDKTQLSYYEKNKNVKSIYNYASERRLLTAINSPQSLYACINDRFHKNRLIIPFYKGREIVTYTSRKIFDFDNKAKYLQKFNSDKAIFNIDRIDYDLNVIFLFEGPIDAMFVKNGVAVSGLTLTSKQEEELSQFPFHRRIWVLDNLKKENKEVVNKAISKINDGEELFLFEDEFSDFKDFNEYCIKNKSDEISSDLLLKHVYSGQKALMRIN